MNWKERTVLLLGENAVEKLARATVVVVGVGGVGAAAAEMLARAGVGHLVLIDNDCVAQSNINRQLPALHSTVGKVKTEVLSGRLRDINPDLIVETLAEYVSEDNMCIGHPSFVVDAIDTLSPKIALIQYCLKENIPMVSSMGAGAKIDATAVRIDDISATHECPLAHMLRKRLHKLGIKEGFPAVYSIEKPIETAVVMEESRNKKSQVGTISYLPTVFGCACAQVAIGNIIK